MRSSFDCILGVAPSGDEIGRVTLANAHLRVGLSNYGARMLSIEAPDRDGRFDHVLLGFDDPATILKADSFGAVLGRYANRIADGRFDLDGATSTLPRNDGDSTLHGGPQGFSRRFWRLTARSDDRATFALESPDGDQGFPGALSVQASYALDGSALRLVLEATTTRPTPVNLSAHPYFNLGGPDALDVCDHVLHVAATRYLPTDTRQIPTGAMHAVEGTVFDFRTPVVIGTRIRGSDPQLVYARGYDHCFVLDGAAGSLRTAARVTHPASGRTLAVETDRPGLQVYTSNSLDGSLVGHGGCYRQSAALALEAEAFPDAPNQPDFPSTILRPGDRFAATIVYRFSVA